MNHRETERAKREEERLRRIREQEDRDLGFDHLDLSINLFHRRDLSIRMNHRQREERRKMQKKKVSENSKKARQLAAVERPSPPQSTEDFDPLDLSINMTVRKDLAARMTPEQRVARKKKQYELSLQKARDIPSYRKEVDIIFKRLKSLNIENTTATTTTSATQVFNNVRVDGNFYNTNTGNINGGEDLTRAIQMSLGEDVSQESIHSPSSPSEEYRRNLTRLEVLKIDNDNDDKENLCVICLTRKACILFEVCSHLCICQSCLDPLISHSSSRNNTVKCPICRADSTTKRIFLS